MMSGLPQQAVLDRAAVALTAAAGALAIMPQSRVARAAHQRVVSVLSEIDATPDPAACDDSLLLRAMVESAVGTLREMLRSADESGFALPLRDRVGAIVAALAEHCRVDHNAEERSDA